ncbi:MAG: FKBP-type peptidyl-prolyl cis-trans isomerase [Opitutaceae bacterium]
MKINHTPRALVLCLVAASTAIAQDTKVAAPAQAAAQPAAAQPAAAAAAPTYTDAQLLEEFGWYIGKRTGLSELGLAPAEADQLSKGMLEAMNGKDSPFEIQKVGPAMTEFIQKKQSVVLETIKNKNLAQAAAYFAKLKEIKDVVELPDGLRYEIENPGTGSPPKPTDTVKVNYTGALIDGTVFDSSERQGKPGEFVLNSVIAGWTEGLQKIGKGGKMRLFVPPQLGYGDDGRPGIPPGSVLVFQVELLDINPVPAAAAPAASK